MSGSKYIPQIAQEQEYVRQEFRRHCKRLKLVTEEVTMSGRPLLYTGTRKELDKALVQEALDAIAAKAKESTDEAI